MAGATKQDIFGAIFGSGFDQYSWWIDVRLLTGERGDDYFAPRDGWVVEVTVEDPEEDDASVSKELTAQDIKNACHKIMRDKSFRKGLRDECSHLLFDEEELDMDANDADTVMQYVMFDGEIVYG